MDNVEELPAHKRMIWFTAPVCNALAHSTDWWRAVHVVGKYYSNHMPELNQTVWDAARAAGHDRHAI